MHANLLKKGGGVNKAEKLYVSVNAPEYYEHSQWIKTQHFRKHISI